jgi:hypothetical protein
MLGLILCPHAVKSWKATGIRSFNSLAHQPHRGPSIYGNNITYRIVMTSIQTHLNDGVVLFLNCNWTECYRK